MLEFLLDRKHCIAFLVIGWLVRGMVYHFFPLFNSILLWLTAVWIGIILISEIVKKEIRIDAIAIAGCAFLAVMILSTAINHRSIEIWEEIDFSESVFSIIEAIGLLCVLFPAAKHEETDRYRKFLNHLFLAVVCYINLLALGSVILFVCYRMNIALPGGFGGAEQIFTYGHLGEDMRFCGLFGYSTDGGNLCALAAALAVYLYEQKKLPLILTVLSIALSAYTIYLLDVRTSMLALLLGAMVLGVYLLGKRIGKKKAAGLVLAAAVILIAAVLVLKKGTIDHYLALYREDPRKTLSFLTTGRSKHWETAIRGWLEKPILGWGWLNNSYGGRYFDNHNLFVNLLLWTGAAGTGCFLVHMVLWIVRAVKNRKNRGIGMLLALLAVFVQSMLDRAIMGSANAGVETQCFWLIAGWLVYQPNAKNL